MDRKKWLYSLLFLIVFTSIFSAMTLAKYGSNHSTTPDYTIAKWSVSTNNDSNKTINLVSGNNEATYTVRVTSTSEVAATYSIELTSVPSNTEVKLDSGSFVSPNNSGTILFGNVGTINTGNSSEHVHTLTFKADLNETEMSNRTVGVNVIFVQDVVY